VLAGATGFAVAVAGVVAPGADFAGVVTAVAGAFADVAGGLVAEQPRMNRGRATARTRFIGHLRWGTGRRRGRREM
jgi:hypothetical protein